MGTLPPPTENTVSFATMACLSSCLLSYEYEPADSRPTLHGARSLPPSWNLREATQATLSRFSPPPPQYVISSSLPAQTSGSKADNERRNRQLQLPPPQFVVSITVRLVRRVQHVSNIRTSSTPRCRIAEYTSARSSRPSGRRAFWLACRLVIVKVRYAPTTVDNSGLVLAGKRLQRATPYNARLAAALLNVEDNARQREREMYEAILKAKGVPTARKEVVRGPAHRVQ
ncbi:hypothetical protein C8Q80DRAFT_437850 [Daedaleopsis nitida]|nr:hypothetical protein C8Q80DRAFT_437850 [Daedaleopsis nitida]